MSNISINFLRQRHKALTLLQKTDRKYAIILGYVTATVIVVSIGMFALQLYLTSALDGVKKDETKVTNQISALAPVEFEYLTLAQKFTEIKTLIKGKSLQQEAVEYFSTLFAQQQVSLTEVDRDKDGILSFKISAQNVFQLQQVMSFLQTKDVLTKYPTLTLSDLSREKTGVYVTTVSVVLPIVSPTPVPKKNINPLDSALK